MGAAESIERFSHTTGSYTSEEDAARAFDDAVAPFRKREASPAFDPKQDRLDEMWETFGKAKL